MAFDQSTRNRLQKFVSDARKLLSEEFTQQLQNTFGLDPVTGGIAELSDLPSLSPSEQQTAKLLRDTLEHYLAASHKAALYADKALVIATLDRIVREQAFTVLNRLVALRMSEARMFVMESISKGYQSKGFQLYQRIAGSALRETGQSYQTYLFSVFDELSLDLAVLFDRYSSQGRLFPRETVLLELLDLVNHAELEALWAEDETVGWIYQYFNSKEERKNMRDESQAPRNSRELAVRNQFFTPRYVVEFLTDNTLGRIWYEMTKGKTTLVDSCLYLVRRPNEIFMEPDQQVPVVETDEMKGLSQAELLQQTVYIQHRPLKDPRDIKMLDPACGSMHFGLYAYDLFEKIYSEAWDLEEAGETGNFIREVNKELGGDVRQSLHQFYESKDAFLADVPRLIIEHNIHGVDIDPRAAQIAGLSLWLRAQKSWTDNAIQPNQRPQVQRSNIVCAEPMPGEKELLKEFISQVQPRVLGQLVEEIFDKMQLAGEAGTLLKIEEEIQAAIEDAKSQKDEKVLEVQGGLFGDNKWEVREGKRYYNLGDIGDDFWSQAEYLILAELERYAELATGEGSGQKRLFATDAAKGFAFIDLCRRRFDVVLMNPPYGSPSKQCKSYLSEVYPVIWIEIYIAFCERALDICPDGYIGSLTSRTWMYLQKFNSFREDVLENRYLLSLLDLGPGVLDGAAVETAAYVLSRKNNSKLSEFYDLQKTDTEKFHFDKSAIEFVDGTGSYKPLIRDIRIYSDGNNSPLKYKGEAADENLISSMELYTAKPGLGTRDDFRFIRLWWELPFNQSSNKIWSPIAFGGKKTKFFASHNTFVKWADSGYELKAFIEKNYGSASRSIVNEKFYYKRGITYQYTGNTFRAHFMPEGMIISMAGQGLYSVDGLDVTLLGLLNTNKATSELKKINPGRFFQASYVNSLNFDRKFLNSKKLIDEASNKAVKASYAMSLSLETSPQFNASQVLQSKIDFEKYIDSLKISYIESVTLLNKLADKAFPEDSDVDEDDDFLAYAEWGSLSVLIGVVFGRWKIQERVRTPVSLDEISIYPKVPSPYGNDLLGAKYICESGICSNERDDPESLPSRIELILEERGFGSFFKEDNYVDVKKFIDHKFFTEHLSLYTENKRPSPIYWPISSLSGSFTLWVYYHQLDEQTLYTCVNDFIGGKLKAVADEVLSLQCKTSKSGAEENTLEKLVILESELKDYQDEILRIAQFWKPNRHDGVQINAAPLWRLFLHKPWQKKLKKTWEELEEGKYDWSHMAYNIWPERVLKKCHQDRSIAIAHDVEAGLWEEIEVPAARGRGTKWVWQPKEMTETELDAFIQQKIAKG